MTPVQRHHSPTLMLADGYQRRAKRLNAWSLVTTVIGLTCVGCCQLLLTNSTGLTSGFLAGEAALVGGGLMTVAFFTNAEAGAMKRMAFLLREWATHADATELPEPLRKVIDHDDT